MKHLLAILTVALSLVAARADDSVNARLLALFPHFDADHDALLSPAEQDQAVESVRSQYGETWARQVRTLFQAAATNGGAVAETRWQEQARTFGEIHRQTFRIPMRDGVLLATDAYLPAGTGPFPVVLTRTPYSRVNARDSSSFTRYGLVYVVQDMRGRFDSKGVNLPFVGCGWGEHQDGVDTLAWLRQQPWCNGKIGTVGGSAGGITQNLLAGAAPAGLAVQYISVAAANLYADAAYIGGAFRKADIEGWTTNNKFDPRGLELMRAHPYYDDYWQNFDTTLKFSVMTVPAVHLGGWFDMFAQATLDEFVGRQHHGAPGSRGTQKIVMGPWTHGLGKMPVGDLTFPGSSIPKDIDAGRWWEHYLFGITNGVETEPAVTYYTMGDAIMPGAPGNVWRHADDWPVPATETALYFTRDGQLAAAKPSVSGDAPVEFTFDPANPCPTLGGNNLNIDRGPRNQNPIEKRGDVVVFTSAPLAEPVEVTGRVRVNVFVSSSAVDSDLSVRLCDVYPDGKSYLIAEGMLRLRCRNSFEKPELLTPGKIEEVRVDCWSTSIVFNKGHCIRATVTSSNYPRFDINPGTGRPWADGGETVKQTNRIYCDAAHASRLLLPVVPTVAKDR